MRCQFVDIQCLRTTVALLLLGSLWADRGSASWDVHDLGEFGPPNFYVTGVVGVYGSIARGINSVTVVVGTSNDSLTVGRAFRWAEGNGLLPLDGDGDSLGYSEAAAINDAGDVAGLAAIGDAPEQARVWYATGGVQTLGTLGGPRSYARDINAYGRVVGTSDTGASTRGFSWTPGTGMVELAPIPGGEESWANAVVDVPGLEVVGAANTPIGSKHAVDWIGDPLTPFDLGTLPGGSNSEALAINLHDLFYRIVGISDTNAGSHAFIIKSGGPGMEDLGTLPGGRWSRANAVNSVGEVVGASGTDPLGQYMGVVHAVIWDPTGVIRDLNDEIPPDAGWTLLEATGINDQSQVVGYGVGPDQRQHAFFLTDNSSWVGGEDRHQDLLAMGEPLPNPTAEGLRILLTAPSQGRARLRLVDPSGRLIHTVYEGDMQRGARWAVWDGRLWDGRAAVSGVYFLVLDFNGRRLTRGVVVMR